MMKDIAEINTSCGRKLDFYVLVNNTKNTFQELENVDVM